MTALLADLPSRTGMTVVHVTHRREEVAAAGRGRSAWRRACWSMRAVGDAGRSRPTVAGGHPSHAPMASRGHSTRDRGGSFPRRVQRLGVDTRRAPHLRGRHALGAAGPAGIDLTIEPREGVLIVGGNGSGKSTLAWIMAGVLRPRGVWPCSAVSPSRPRWDRSGWPSSTPGCSCSGPRWRADLRAAGAADDAGGGRGPGRRSASTWRRSASGASTSSAAGSSGGWRWPASWPASRRCWSSTSPWPVWTSPARRPSSACSPTCGMRARSDRRGHLPRPRRHGPGVRPGRPPGRGAGWWPTRTRAAAAVLTRPAPPAGRSPSASIVPPASPSSERSRPTPRSIGCGPEPSWSRWRASSVTLSYFPSWGSIGLIVALLLADRGAGPHPEGGLAPPADVVLDRAADQRRPGRRWPATRPHLTIGGVVLGFGGLDAYCRFVAVGVALLLGGRPGRMDHAAGRDRPGRVPPARPAAAGPGTGRRGGGGGRPVRAQPAAAGG